MNPKRTLIITEWGKIDIDKIAAICGDEAKAKKYFDELEEFAKGKNNDKFLRFHGKATLQAKNFVGLLQTKSGFCVEILPKIYRDRESIDCECEEKYKFDKESFKDKMAYFGADLDSTSKDSANVGESKKSAESKSPIDSTNPANSPNSKNLKTCPLCASKQILLNCLESLKDSPFKKNDLANLNINKLPLLEIFVIMFIDEVEKLVKQGIKSDYVEKSQNRKFLKGKLLFGENLKHNLAHKERFFTQSDEFIADIAPNRLIVSTLHLLYQGSFSPKTSVRLNQLRFIFDEIRASCNISADFAKCRISRHFKAYELVLKWCEIFLCHKAWTPYSGADLAFAFLLDMNKLFESFVTKMLKIHAKDYEIEAQAEHSPKHLINTANGDKFKLLPDIVARLKKSGESKILIIDTKWKNIDSLNKIAQSDLYQVFAYACKYANTSDTQTPDSKIKVLLIYPEIRPYNTQESHENSADLSDLITPQNPENLANWHFKANKIPITLIFFPLF
ncbi:hypothetical protein CCY99_03415 [Helicobacter sp. 16-1353]|uniref:McrC family protein n=1 Tax=Helicobacter sp. 16-1353 TaxID=2004996 RepID=UPI000DCC65E5|nr:McrC family protein [Helicobacter sp. 16-1353]RAX54415.1 hypothetical protein CCY99_03415 [Helicobacter sp. 16-1353]